MLSARLLKKVYFLERFFPIFLFLASPLAAQDGVACSLNSDQISAKGYVEFLNSGLIDATPEAQAVHSYLSQRDDSLLQGDPSYCPPLETSQKNLQCFRWSDDFYDEQMLSSSILRTGFPGSYHYDCLASLAYAHDVIVGLSWRDVATYCHYYSLKHREAQGLLPKSVHNGFHEDFFLRTNHVFYHLYYSGDAAHSNMTQQEGDDSTMRSHDLLFESIVGGVITLGPILGIGAIYFHRNQNLHDSRSIRLSHEDSSNRILLHDIEMPLSGNNLDQLQNEFEACMIDYKRSQDEHRQVINRVLKNPFFTLYSALTHCVGCLPSITSPMIEEAKARLEAADEKLSHLMERVGAMSVEEIYNQITESPSKRSIIDVHRGMSEEAPEAQSFCFGRLLKKECEATQQDVINNSIKNSMTSLMKISKDPYEDMRTDLSRTHQNQAKYSLIEEHKIIELNNKDGIENLNIFKNFVGVRYPSLQIAIASIMHQGAQADFEKMKLGAPRDHRDVNSCPFFTKGPHTELWSPRLEGPIFPKLFSNEGREEIQLYDLKKITAHQPPLFEFTATCRQSVHNSDFTYHLSRHVRYHIEIDRTFKPNFPITEENIPVKIRCLDGKIVQLFDQVLIIVNLL